MIVYDKIHNFTVFYIRLQTTNQFLRRYQDKLNNFTYTQLASAAYDAVWSLAFALNSTNTMLAWPTDRIINETNCEDDNDQNGFQLDNFTYKHAFVGCIIRWNLAKTNFIGVSVSVF